MLGRRSHVRQRRDVGAYLLGALPAAQARAFERHLSGCARCREELDRLRVAVDALPQSVEPVEPPPELKLSLMRQVEAEAAERTAAVADADRPGEPAERSGSAGAGAAVEGRPAGELHASPDAGADQGAREGAAFGRRRRSGPVAAGLLGRLLPSGWPRLPRPALAAGAAAALALAMVGAYGLGRAVEDAGPGARPARTIAATADHDRVPGARAELVVAPAPGAPAVLRVRNLAVLRDRVYEIWVRRGERVLPAAVFTVRADGSAEAAIERGLGGADAVLVTRERPGGARRPSELPVLAVEL